MANSRDKSMEEALYKLVQKVDDLKELVLAQAPILAKVPVHGERISWINKQVVVLWSVIGTAASAAAAYVFHGKGH